jgi:hypothetical protein
MRTQNDSLRGKIEKVVAGISAATIVAFVTVGTFQMCPPGVLGA